MNPVGTLRPFGYFPSQGSAVGLRCPGLFLRIDILEKRQAWAGRAPFIAAIRGQVLALGGSHGADVTGGMAAKVVQSLRLAAQYPGLEVIVGSGLTPGNLQHMLVDPAWNVGTRIHAPNGC